MTNLFLCHGSVNRAPNQIADRMLSRNKREWTKGHRSLSISDVIWLTGASLSFTIFSISKKHFLHLYTVSSRATIFGSSISTPILAKAFRIRVLGDKYKVILYLGLVFEPHRQQSFEGGNISYHDCMRFE